MELRDQMADWKLVTHFFVPGTPQPGGSKRAFVAPGKNGSKPRAIVTDAAKKNKQWRAVVAVAAEMVYDGDPIAHHIPLRVVVRFASMRPRSHYGTGRNSDKLKPSAPDFPTTRPDATKLWRSTEDALTGILWVDDSQVVRQDVSKIYAGSPGASIHLYQYAPEAGAA